MRPQVLVHVILLAVLEVSFAVPCLAATWHVYPPTGINTAINNASAGDTLMLHRSPTDSVYVENIVWNNKDLQVLGDRTQQPPILRPAVLTQPACHCTGLGAGALSSRLDYLLVEGPGGTPGSNYATAVLIASSTMMIRDVDVSGFRENQGIGGGAARVIGGAPTFFSCAFQDNSSTKMGGAAAVFTAGSIEYPVKFRQCSFVQNQSPDQLGGAGGALAIEDSHFEVRASVFQGNSAYRGGAFFLEGDQTYGLFIGSDFTANYAVEQGGAGDMLDCDGTYWAPEAPIWFNGCQFTDNSCDVSPRFFLGRPYYPSRGGAVSLTGTHVHFENNCTFLRNAANRGGALAVYQMDMETSEHLKITDCVFEGNAAVNPDSSAECDAIPVVNGGAIYANTTLWETYPASKAAVSVTVDGQTQFTENFATGRGGAVYFAGTVAGELTGATFDRNVANCDGGALSIWCGNAVAIESCTFRQNTCRAMEDGYPVTSDGGGYGGAVSSVDDQRRSADPWPGWMPPFADGFCDDAPGGDLGYLTIRYSTFDRDSANWGGAVAIGRGRPGQNGRAKGLDITVEHNTFSENNAIVAGGALYEFVHQGDPAWTGAHVIQDNVFENNAAEPLLPYYVEYRSLGGGAVFDYGVMANPKEYIGNRFEGNLSTAFGGAVASEDGNPQLNGNEFLGNRVRCVASEALLAEVYSDIGGQSVYWTGGNGICWPRPCFGDERWFYGRGGAVYTTASLEMVENVIIGNYIDVPAADGAGVYGGVGGGLALRSQPGALVRVVNNLIAQNYVDLEGGTQSLALEGGGMQIEFMDNEFLWPDTVVTGSIEVENNVLVDNNAECGGGIYVHEQANEGYVRNNIVMCNSSDSTGGIYGAPYVNQSWDPEYGVQDPERFAYNDVWDNSGGQWGGVLAENDSLYGNLSADPDFRGFSCSSLLFDKCDFILACSSPVCGVGDPATPGENCFGMLYDLGIFGGGAPCSLENVCGLPIEFTNFQHSILTEVDPPMVRVTWNTAVTAYSQIQFADVSGQHVLPVTPVLGTSHSAEFVYEPLYTYELDALGRLEGDYGCTVVEDVYGFQIGRGRGARLAATAVSEGALLEFDLPAAGAVRVEVIDVSGRCVRTMEQTYSPGGPQSIVWDGRDGNGAGVPRGIYFCHIQAGGHAEKRRVLIVK